MAISLLVVLVLAPLALRRMRLVMVPRRGRSDLSAVWRRHFPVLIAIRSVHPALAGIDVRRCLRRTVPRWPHIGAGAHWWVCRWLHLECLLGRLGNSPRLHTVCTHPIMAARAMPRGLIPSRWRSPCIRRGRRRRDNLPTRLIADVRTAGLGRHSAMFAPIAVAMTVAVPRRAFGIRAALRLSMIAVHAASIPTPEIWMPVILPAIGPMVATFLTPADVPIPVVMPQRRADAEMAAMPRTAPGIEPDRIERPEADVGIGRHRIAVVLDDAGRPFVVVTCDRAETVRGVGVDDGPLGRIGGVAALQHNLHKIVGSARFFDEHRAFPGKIVGYQRTYIRALLRRGRTATELHEHRHPTGSRQRGSGVYRSGGDGLVLGHASGGAE